MIVVVVGGDVFRFGWHVGRVGRVCVEERRNRNFSPKFCSLSSISS